MLFQRNINKTRHEDRFELENPKKTKPSRLFNEKTFYKEFIKDMLGAKKEVIIYCPFISKYRSDFFRHTLLKLRKRSIDVFIFTRPLEEHEVLMRDEISCALKDYEELGVCVLYLSGSIHEKLAIIDREVLWEGSLNILSQRKSREMMRKIQDENLAKQMLHYLELQTELAKGYKDKYERQHSKLIADSNERHVVKMKLLLTGVTIIVAIWWLFIDGNAMILALKNLIQLMDTIRQSLI